VPANSPPTQSPLAVVTESSLNVEPRCIKVVDTFRFGFSHWRDFRRTADVTDRGCINASINMFKPLFPGGVRLFKVAELPVAKDWIASFAATT
jgi:hypothetical protein